MSSSLYDDISVGDADKAKGWGANSGFRLLGTQLRNKKEKLLTTKKGGPTMAPVLNLKPRAPREEGSVTFNHLTGKLEKVNKPRARSPPPPLPSSEWSKPKPTSYDSKDDSEEYNPLRPNDYDKIVAERRRREAEEREKRKEEERKKEEEEREKRRKERQARRDAEDKERKEKRRRGSSESSSDDEDDDKKKRRAGAAAIAPPVALTQTDPVEEKKEEPLDPESMPGTKLFGGVGGGGAGTVSFAASKIMAKYGFKDGQGLGKGGQGMSTALVVEKTSKRGGKIIHEKDLEYDDSASNTPPPAENAAASNSAMDLVRNPSKVVLLRNMVGPGEVDEDLEPETKEECNEKYGDVITCTIYEVPNADDEEAVRIFVEFKRVEAAIKAVVDLNGRFFGGRSVKASFYNFDDYKALSLGLPA